MKLTLEERKEKLLKRIEELGVIYMSDADSLEAMECACDAIEKFNKEYPIELLALQHKLIEKNRGWVWKLPKEKHHFYFDKLQKISHALWKENWASERIEKFVNKHLSGKDYYENHTDHKNRNK